MYLHHLLLLLLCFGLVAVTLAERPRHGRPLGVDFEDGDRQGLSPVSVMEEQWEWGLPQLPFWSEETSCDKQEKLTQQAFLECLSTLNFRKVEEFEPDGKKRCSQKESRIVQTLGECLGSWKGKSYLFGKQTVVVTRAANGAIECEEYQLPTKGKHTKPFWDDCRTVDLIGGKGASQDPGRLSAGDVANFHFLRYGHEEIPACRDDTVRSDDFGFYTTCLEALGFVPFQAKDFGGDCSVKPELRNHKYPHTPAQCLMTSHEPTVVVGFRKSDLMITCGFYPKKCFETFEKSKKDLKDSDIQTILWMRPSIHSSWKN